MRILYFISAFLFYSTAALGSSTETTCDPQRAEGGFLPIQKEVTSGRVLMEIRDLGMEALYFPYTGSSPATADIFFGGGVGGGPSIGLDDDMWGYKSGIIRFRRVGTQVAVELKNLRFRETGSDPLLQRLLEEQISTSVIAMLPIVSEMDSCILVDIAPLAMIDAGSHIVQAKVSADMAMALDPKRSFVNVTESVGKTGHTEISSTLTFSIPAPPAAMNRVTPDPKSLSIAMRHAFVRLPEGMRPRPGHPLIASGNFGALRVNYGTVGISYFDVSADITSPRRVHLVNRFRLEKSDPKATLSDPVEPIVIYLDPRLPALYRDSIGEAALDWGTAFEAAGFSNAIEVRVADDSVDPLDVKTNYIFWSEDQTRAVSMGETFIDPRTGEILSFKVRIDSQRGRYHGEMWAMMRGAIDPDQPGAITPTREEYSAYRIRMLALHEIGHGLGLGHNMSASVSGRASIMDYVMAPRFDITNAGKLSFSDWHTPGLGAYDFAMIKYLYTPFSEADETAGLASITEDMKSEGLILTDVGDARWNEYDDYSDPVEQLEKHIAQRSILLANFGEAAVDPGDYLGRLRKNLQFAFLYHRSAIDRGVKNIGGYHEEFTRRGETSQPFAFVSANTQRAVLEHLVGTIRPEALAFPEDLIKLLGPQPERSLPSTDEIKGRAGMVTDPLSAARTLVASVVGPLMAPDRAQRLMIQSSEDPQQLGLSEVIDSLIAASVKSSTPSRNRHKILQQIASDETVTSIAALAENTSASPEVRAVAAAKLAEYELTAAAATSSALPRPKGPAN